MYNLPLTLIKNSDGTYTVLSNLFNIVTQGDNLEEALKNGKEALECHMQGLVSWDDEYDILRTLKDSINTSVIV